MNYAIRKALRTLAQFIVSGGLTAAVNSLAGGMTANNKVLVLAVWTVVVSLAQNALEKAGIIPTILPTAPAGTEAPKELVHTQ